uniref:Uncharacterized protein n=1 Tax=Candidatus Kentrum sp. LFY TaxID=2126342 RepID=A0A450UE27_9GAMM|nr:MAG: hypothetical protein BECKLFY1418B_GA0070995_10216 [Candidatus Kentron sp. LFY]
MMHLARYDEAPVALVPGRASHTDSTSALRQTEFLETHRSRIFNVECKSRFFRFHNNNDIVTRAPARAMGYSHVGSYLYISEEKTIHREPGFWFRFIDHFDGAFSALKEQGLDSIKDHDMNRYLRAIRKWDLE